MRFLVAVPVLVLAEVPIGMRVRQVTARFVEAALIRKDEQPRFVEIIRRTDRMLGGVCGGFARYLGIDPVVARVLFVLLTFVTGGALVIGYLIFWILMPEEPAVIPTTMCVIGSSGMP